MKIYEDSSKTELVAELPDQSIFALLEWDGSEYSRETCLFSIPLRPDGSNEIFNVLVAASADFGTDFDCICCDRIELCIDLDKLECCLYINNGEEEGIWGSVELSKDGFLKLMDEVYRRWRERFEYEYIVSK